MTTGAISPGGHRHRRVPFNEMVRFDAMRSADWRWQRAWWHVWEDRRFCPGRDDEATGRAVAFLRAWQRCNTKRQFSGLRRRDPDLFAAHALQESQSRARIEVEARLLAGQSVAEIAKRTSLPMPVIEVYVTTFFDVQDSLSATGWIMAHAVLPKFVGQVEVDDFAVVVKGHAFHYGPVLLDAILATVVDDYGKFTTTKASDFTTAEGKLAARTALFLMPHLALQNNALVAELVRINELISQIELAEATSHAPGEDLTTIVDPLMTGVTSALILETNEATPLEASVDEHSEEGQDRHVA